MPASDSPDEHVPVWLRNDLKEVKDALRDLPELLERTFMRKDNFAEFRAGLEHRLSELGTAVVDVHGDVRLVERDIENMKQANMEKERAQSDRALALAQETRTASRKVWLAILVAIVGSVTSSLVGAWVFSVLTNR